MKFQSCGEIESMQEFEVGGEMMKKRSTTVVVVILTLIMTVMEMSALPAALFCNV